MIRSTPFRILLVVVALAVLALAGREIPALLPRFVAWVESLGAWGPVAFIAGYSIAPVVFAPAQLTISSAPPQRLGSFSH